MNAISFGSSSEGRPRARDERRGGMALVIVLLVLVSLSFAGVSILSASLGQHRSSAAEAISNRSLECAVAGGNWGMGRLTGNLGDGGSRDALLPQTVMTGTLGPANLAGNVSVTIADNDDGDGDTSVDSDKVQYTQGSCTVQNSTSRVEMLGSVFMGSAFSGGVCGCQSVELGASTSVDSYDSLLGTYDGAYGNVVSNGDVDVNGAIVDGNVYAGGNIFGGGTINGDAWAGGSVTGVTVNGVTRQGDSPWNDPPPPTSCRCAGATQINGDPTIDNGTAAAKTNNGNLPPPQILPAEPGDCETVNPAAYDQNAGGAMAYLDALATKIYEGTTTCLKKFYPGYEKSASEYYCSPSVRPSVAVPEPPVNVPCCLTMTSSDPFSVYTDGSFSGRYIFRKTTGTCAFTTGTYYFVEFETGGSGTVVIDKRLDPTDFMSKTNDNVIFYWDQKATGSTDNDFKLFGTSISNEAELSLNLEIYSRTTRQVTLRGTTALAGIVYAPYASAILTGTSTVYGAIFGQIVDISGTPDIHYDVNLMKRDDFDEGFTPLAGTWRALR